VVEVVEAYFEGEKKDFDCEFDKQSAIRPAWIRLINNSALPKFVKVLGNDNTFHFYKRKFGGYFLPVNISLDETKLFYKRVATEFDKIAEFNNKQFGKFVAKKLSENKIPKDKEVLDVCAGTGVQSQVLVEASYKNMALLDFSEEMLAQAKSKKALSKNADFILADLTKFSSNKKYDAIVSSMGLQYFDNYNWAKVLEIMKNSLKKEGLVIVVEDNKRSAYPEGFKLLEEGSVIVDLESGKKSAKFFFVLKKEID